MKEQPEHLEIPPFYDEAKGKAPAKPLRPSEIKSRTEAEGQEYLELEMMVSMARARARASSPVTHIVKERTAGYLKQLLKLKDR
ncbi:MAG: hypothetical protein CMI12_01640 [Oceanospirillum sp.]|nr:hypothetical protein [Oceanospirillum sp.]